MVMKGGKKRALSPAKEGEAATIEEVPLTRSVSTRLSGSSFLLRYFYFSSDKVGVNSYSTCVTFRGSEDEPPKKLIKWTNKTRVLVLAARGLSFR